MAHRTILKAALAPTVIVMIGAGAIGASWAAAVLARGYDVTACDPSPT
jgi:3-hydroxyacyl-CoA dehydrogenase